MADDNENSESARKRRKSTDTNVTSSALQIADVDIGDSISHCSTPYDITDASDSGNFSKSEITIERPVDESTTEATSSSGIAEVEQLPSDGAGTENDVVETIEDNVVETQGNATSEPDVGFSEDALMPNNDDVNDESSSSSLNVRVRSHSDRRAPTYVSSLLSSNFRNDSDNISQASSTSHSSQTQQNTDADIGSSPDEDEPDDNVLSPTNFLYGSNSSDSDTDFNIEDYPDAPNDNRDMTIVNEVLNKQKPSYSWNHTYEIMRREHGLSGNGRYSLRNGFSTGFNNRFYSSRHVIERLELSHSLKKHNGCVNCLNFNKSGDLLVSGSDDMRIAIWNWAEKKIKLLYRSGHNQNIFQTKFVNSDGCLQVVSASRDGQVRRATINSSGKSITNILYKHTGPVHKLTLSPQNVYEILSVGEDAYIRSMDLRTDDASHAFVKVLNSKKKKVRLFSIAHHPFAPEICVCGSDNIVRVYDKRNSSSILHEMYPQNLVETTTPQVTCCVYNNTGTEILASYTDDFIYLFDNKNYKKGEFLHCYKGHYNHKTIKGVNFFGINSEYIISGSDCGNIFIWDKNTESILNFLHGDNTGVVNCLESHPTFPVLATSGLDHNIKIWTPTAKTYPPDMTKLDACIKRNLRRSVLDEGNEFDDRQFRYFIRQFMRRGRRENHHNDDDDFSQVEDVHMSSSDSSSISISETTSSEEEYPSLDSIQCRTQ